MIKVTCIECSKSFEAQRSSAKFCTANCRVKYNIKSNGKSVEPHPEVSASLKTIASAEVLKTERVLTKEDIENEKRWQLAKDKINKDFGEGSIMCLGDSPSKQMEVISTGSFTLDAALGIGGLPCGRMIEIYGQESSGKTTIALHVIAEANKLGKKCAFIDAEHAFDEEYAKNLKVDMNLLEVSQPDYGEIALEVADRAIESKNFAVVVVDSVAALTPKSEIEGEMGDSKMGSMARLMSQACRKLVASVSKTNTILIFLNQLREKIGVVYGSPFVVTGGNALKFYASIRLEVSRIGKIIDGEVQLGNKTKVKVVKSKVAPPYKVAEFDIMFGEGISKTGEIIDRAVQLNIINKAGSWYSYNNDKIGQGRDASMQLLKDNPELSIEIENKIKAHTTSNN